MHYMPKAIATTHMLKREFNGTLLEGGGSLDLSGTVGKVTD